MLALTRRPGESILIGDQIRVTLIDARGKRVKIGVEAPPDFFIRRADQTKDIFQANARSILSAPVDSDQTLRAVLGVDQS